MDRLVWNVAHGLSTIEAGPAFVNALSWANLKVLENEIPRKDTILRAVVLYAECCRDYLAEQSPHWKGLTLGFDKTSSGSRNLFEATMNGQDLMGDFLTFLLGLHELHRGEDPLSVLLIFLEELQTRQKELNIPVIKLYDWTAMVMDNAADGKGEKNGVGVRFDKQREAKYLEYLI